MKLLTELTTLAASVVTVAICAAEGTRNQAPPWRARDLPGLGFILIMIEVCRDTRTRHRPERVTDEREAAGDSTLAARQVPMAAVIPGPFGRKIYRSLGPNERRCLPRSG